MEGTVVAVVIAVIGDVVGCGAAGMWPGVVLLEMLLLLAK